jgi:hypothetical protein
MSLVHVCSNRSPRNTGWASILAPMFLRGFVFLLGLHPAKSRKQRNKPYVEIARIQFSKFDRVDFAYNGVVSLTAVYKRIK